MIIEAIGSCSCIAFAFSENSEYENDGNNEEIEDPQ